MKTLALNPRKLLNKAYLKVKPHRDEIDRFKYMLSGLLNEINENESEEYNKNIISEFLKKSYYEDEHFINTKDKSDLVIHNGEKPGSSVGVIIETKKPSNHAEMLKHDNINAKALHELILYFMRERITNNNLEIKHLIATNGFEWFVFDAAVFEKEFAQNKNFVKSFKDFESGILSSKKTELFYNDIAKPYVSGLEDEISFAYFDVRIFKDIIFDHDPKNDSKLITLFKLLSPEHLLKQPFANDSNSLDKKFYAELLHIIGLTETKKKGKKLIERKAPNDREPGSLLENAINQLETHFKLDRLANPKTYGETREEQKFTIALELVITWINRILFMKLMEAQLLTYHKDEKKYSFLNINKIPEYDDLDKLFFGVLARTKDERPENLKEFENIPYLNSSLFEPTELEHDTLFISMLEDRVALPIMNGTVLKDESGKNIKGNIVTLEYMFRFLNAYDFSSEGSEEIQEENKSLINASVLGLIFEKINGYKDGSFFTPGFITMYMSRETIRRAAVQKFNDEKGWNCKDAGELYNKIEDTEEANRIFNSLKICDPAVGSGHFLVSALNEMIALKHELEILTDENGKRLKNYDIAVANDELTITDDEGNLFEYNPNSNESQRVQKTLFREKQAIIENCLFGVDINANSVKICRLRLWIELLKNAYYKKDGELETLPNIDINIKQGNSLISKFDLEETQFTVADRRNLDEYKRAVAAYKNVTQKQAKNDLKKTIEKIKDRFKGQLEGQSEKQKKLNDLVEKLHSLNSQMMIVGMDKKQEKEKQELETKIAKLSKEVEEEQENPIFDQAFEWRFEFPEVLNEEGDYEGFDVVIGNPPYGLTDKNTANRFFYSNKNNNLYTAFLDLSNQISTIRSNISLIIPSTWLAGNNFKELRIKLIQNTLIDEIIQLPYDIFDVYVDTLIILLNNETRNKINYYKFSIRENFVSKFSTQSISYDNFKLDDEFIIFLDKEFTKILMKYYSIPNISLGDISEVQRGTLPPKENQLKKEQHDGYIPWFNHQVYRYVIDRKEEVYVDYNSLKENKPIELFKSEKIIGRQIISRQFRMQFTYLNEFYSFKKNLYAIYNLQKEYNFFFVLGVLNSTFYSYIQVNYNRSGQRDDFPAFSLKDYRNFKIPDKSHKQSPIIELVDKILEAKKENPEADTSELERVIDRMVYELYGLTEEEIRVVEEG